jgi:metallo-beta-lactamase class B
MKWLAGAFAAALALTPASAQTQRERWNEPGEAFRVIDNVYYVGTAGLGAYLIATPQGHFLIDGALPESVPQIEQNIKALGFKLTDVKYLLNSHAHYDHSGGLQQLKKDTGATFAAMEGDISALEGGFYLGSETEKDFGAPPVKVDRILRDGDTLTLGGVTLKANLTPGHTRGCTSWGLMVRDQGKPHEALIFCSATVAANRLVGPPQYEGIVADYRKTFAKTKTMKVDVFLAPHPEFFDLAGKRAKQKAGAAANPFIDPGAFQPFMARLEAAFERDLKTQETALAARQKAKAP